MDTKVPEGIVLNSHEYKLVQLKFLLIVTYKLYCYSKWLAVCLYPPQIINILCAHCDMLLQGKSTYFPWKC